MAHTQVTVSLLSLMMAWLDGLLSTDAYAGLDIRIAACLLLVSPAVAVVAVDC